MDRAAAERLTRTIHGESPLAVTMREDSRGRWTLNVTDPRTDDPDRVAPFVVRDEEDWNDNRRRFRRRRRDRHGS